MNLPSYIKHDVMRKLSIRFYTMAMFQKSVLNKYLINLDEKKLEKAYKAFKKNYTSAKIEEIKTLKEEEYQDGFLRDLFVDALGYVLKPDNNFNLLREFKNQSDGKKADGAILKDDKAIAVIELKSTKTKDLTKITQQAFNYKNNQPGCKYVITSNFQKLRFYIDYADEHEEFDLFHLTREDFELLYLLLSKDSVFADIPQKLKKESIFHEENVSKQLYKDYSVFKSDLFDNLVKNNSRYDKLTLFKKSQKLIDRFLFMLFAEDGGLLPPNYINRIIKRFEILKKEDAYKPLYIIYRQYFGYMNIGRKAEDPSDDIPAYNGGLFYPDKILDDLKIDDSALIDDLQKLSSYDFNSEVDVNILGHIFEHSLTEIEEITAELEGMTADKTKSKRKKDGVFYTPKYITQYIVENTIGTLCKEKRDELDIAEIEFDKSFKLKKGKLSAKGQKLYGKLDEYKKWLLSLKIVDPACGSGAFLNQALNFLIEEHKIIDDIIAELTNTHLRIFDTDKAILENNLYGVDINEESIEIAKLSLWLRTAQKGRKLSVLSNNIKCGNSLIDDPKVAGDKAFNWQNEFPNVFKNGGFDVVIGNPPYVKARDNDDIQSRMFIEQNYKTPYKMWDLYIPFVEKGIDLNKGEGLCSMIIPDTIGKAEYTSKLIDYIENDNSLYQIDFFPSQYVFQNVGVRSKIIFIKKKKGNFFAKRVSHSPDLYDEKLLSSVSGSDQYILETAKYKIDQRACLTLGDICYVSYGMRLNSDKSDPEKFKKIDLLSNERTNIHSEKYTEGKYINRYKIEKEKYLEWNTERCPRRLVRPTFPELYPQNKLLLSRQKRVSTLSDQGHACDNTIIMAILANNLKEVNNNSIKKYYKNIGKNRIDIENTSIEFNLKFLLSIINSNLITYYIKFASKGKIDFYPDDWKKIPIKKISTEQQQPFIEKTDKMLSLNEQLQAKKSKFLNRVRDNFDIEKITKKLDSFYNFEFKDFVGELKKQKLKLSLLEQDEWEEYFTAYKTEINNLQSEIASTDKAIDQMVYKLYNLTEAEIKIVEEQ